MLMPLETAMHRLAVASQGVDGLVRQLTPPDSPGATNTAMLPPIKTSPEEAVPRPSGKMSLDFIAPNSRPASPETMPPNTTLPRLELLSVLSEAAAIRRGSRPSSPFHPSVPVHPNITLHSPPYAAPHSIKDEYITPVSGGLPSPVWSNYSEPLAMRDRHAADLKAALRGCSPSRHTYGYPYRVGTPGYPPHGVRSGRIQKRSKMASAVPEARKQRHPYDAEEKFALIYLRRENGEKKVEWKDCVLRWRDLFPPGQPRRYKYSTPQEARGLPPTYQPRDTQGLQCRFYRIRTDAGLPRTRDVGSLGGVDTPAARAAYAHEDRQLEKMIVEKNLCRDFVARVKQVASRNYVPRATYRL